MRNVSVICPIHRKGVEKDCFIPISKVSVVDLHTNNAFKRRALTEISLLPVIHDECSADINTNKNFTSDRITRSKTKVLKHMSLLATNISNTFIVCLLILLILGNKYNVTKFERHHGIYYVGIGGSYDITQVAFINIL